MELHGGFLMQNNSHGESCGCLVCRKSILFNAFLLYHSALTMIISYR
ncbi:hypothetical protein EUBSIR_01132 [[Eubacterium] siraeum DSM 15702]|uniref:Uncharacterized protein n=1 Tax=[Eubacterium] siraeum DSM 15702 TaxID=428128 RepID=B0MMP6_9FIRM|nr:hypothetical protein EUBSIR_01132 [[Eubacterium] siraeum DSM 15702]